MPQIAHTRSLALTYALKNGSGTLDITDARHYTKFTIDLPAHADLSSIALEVNAGGGWKTLHTSLLGSTQEVTLTADEVNMIHLATPMKGGIRFAIVDTQNPSVDEITFYVTMSGSLYSEGRR